MTFIIGKKWNYYNEYDPAAAAWCRELIKLGHAGDGVVDERSILDVTPDDLRGFTQCHFFAGILGWSAALRLAGVSDDTPLWTGSPPCQPFSSAGAQKGQNDERHLAPHWATLIDACAPPIVFGEQVASAAVFGKAAKRARVSVETGAADGEWAWLDDLFDRLEGSRYACGASDIPAAGVDAPHLRQRTFFGAVRLVDATGWIVSDERQQRGGEFGLHPEDGSGLRSRYSGARSGPERLGHTDDAGLERQCRNGDGSNEPGRIASEQAGSNNDGRGSYDRLADSAHIGIDRGGNGRESGRAEHPVGGGPERLADSDGRERDGLAIEQGNVGHGQDAGRSQKCGQSGSCGERVGLDDSPDSRCREEHADAGRNPVGDRTEGRTTGRHASGDPVRSGTGPSDSPWATADWVHCRDAKWRPVEPGTFPLVDGLPRGMGRGGSARLPHPAEARVMRLKGYGNAIVPQAAAVFVRCFLDALGNNG